MHGYSQFVWLTEKFRLQVECLGYGNECKSIMKTRCYHMQRPNIMRRISYL
jgi:hypothetical protein